MQLLLLTLLALAFNAQALAAWSMPLVPAADLSSGVQSNDDIAPCHRMEQQADISMMSDHCDSDHDCQSDCPHCTGLCSSAMATAMPLSSNWPGKRMSPLFHSQAMPKGALASLYRPPIL